jgi:hypothetical protein
MSYSDYGGLCWAKPPGANEWVRFSEAEDASLHTAAPTERPVEAETGLKMDVLIHAAATVGKEYGKEDWLTEHAHHLTIGGMLGVAVISHKGRVVILNDALKHVDYDFPMNPGDPSEYSGELNDCQWRVFFCDHPSVSYVHFVEPDGTEYLGVAGYGVGEHWWLDEQNRYIDHSYHRECTLAAWYDLHRQDYIKQTYRMADRLPRRLKKRLKSDFIAGRYDFDPDMGFVRIGERWPSIEDYYKRLTDWHQQKTVAV